MRSRAKRRMVSWNIRSSSLRTVNGGDGTTEVSATFGIMLPVYPQGARGASVAYPICPTTPVCIGKVYNSRHWRRPMKTWLIALLLTPAAALVAFQGPRCTAVDPDTAKTGDTINASCENVDKSTAANVYLTDGKDDTKVAVT